MENPKNANSPPQLEFLASGVISLVRSRAEDRVSEVAASQGSELARALGHK